MKHARTIFIAALALWLVLTTSAVTIVVWQNYRLRAVIGMGWGAS